MISIYRLKNMCRGQKLHNAKTKKSHSKINMNRSDSNRKIQCNTVKILLKSYGIISNKTKRKLFTANEMCIQMMYTRARAHVLSFYITFIYKYLSNNAHFIYCLSFTRFSLWLLSFNYKIHNAAHYYYYFILIYSGHIFN